MPLSRGAAGAGHLADLVALCVAEVGASLRLYSHAVTVWADDLRARDKELTLVCPTHGNSTSVVSIKDSYEAMLRLYTKDRFDSFRRDGGCIFFSIGNDAACHARGHGDAGSEAIGAEVQPDAAATTPYETRLCQLVFYKWACTHGVDAIVREREAEIRAHRTAHEGRCSGQWQAAATDTSVRRAQGRAGRCARDNHVLDGRRLGSGRHDARRRLAQAPGA